MTGGAALERFSTRGLASADRVDLWEHHNASALLPLSIRSVCDTDFQAVEDNLHLPQITFARVKASPHVIERTADHVRQGASDGVALYFSLSGEAFFYHRDGVHLQRPGTLLVCDVTQPFMRGFAQGLQEYVMTVPRSVFEQSVGGVLPREPVTRSFADVPRGDLNAARLARLMRSTFDDPSASSLVAAEETAIEVLRAMFAPGGEQGASALHAAALAWIRKNLRDPSISVGAVASAVGVSSRTLSRAFAEREATVARTILELRLDVAHRLLAHPGAPSVREVALASGFVSAGHFSRVFRERFACTPAEVAAESAGGSTA